MDLNGQRILITGASRGIGLAHARYFAAQGASLVISARPGSAAALEALAAELRSQGRVVTAVCAELGEAAEKLVSEAVAALAGLDAIVHNAGMVRDSSLPKMSLSDWQLVCALNLDSAFLLARAAWPHFRDGGGGRLLFTTSAAGLYGNFGQGNYSAAKMGLVGLARTLAVEGRRYRIASNCIAPIAATEMNAQVLDKALAGQLPTATISALAAYLCHPRCGESGSVFEAAGGWYAKVHIGRGQGKYFAEAIPSLEQLHDAWQEICSPDHLQFPVSAMDGIERLVKAHFSV